MLFRFWDEDTTNMSAKLEPPKHPHGRRLLVPHVDHRAKTEPDSAWVAVPTDDSDLTKGYTDISYRQFANGANHTVKWLKDNLPASIFAQPFQAFAYVGSKDLRYPFLAVAAGKLELVLVLPSSSVTPEGRERILAQKQCTTFLHSKELAYAVDEAVSLDPTVKAIEFPELTHFLKAEPAEPVPYTKTWADGKDDPWLCFHTSGTTGHPKVIVHTQHMFAQPDIPAGLTDSSEAASSHFAGFRWFLLMPMLHYVGMLLTLSAAPFLGTIPVLLPANAAPLLPVVKTIMKNTNVDGVLLVPALIDALIADPDAFPLLKNLNAVHYAGAPLSITAGRALAPHVQIVPAIGSTDAGAYYAETVNPRAQRTGITSSLSRIAGLCLSHESTGCTSLCSCGTRSAGCSLCSIYILSGSGSRRRICGLSTPCAWGRGKSWCGWTITCL